MEGKKNEDGKQEADRWKVNVELEERKKKKHRSQGG